VQEDWRVIAHHEDRATGTKLDRPGLQAALDLARQGKIDQLLVYRIDRLSRNVRQLASIAEELDTLNVVLRSATEPFDTGSPAGRKSGEDRTLRKPRDIRRGRARRRRVSDAPPALLSALRAQAATLGARMEMRALSGPRSSAA
jgi:DNA invertase Pin-like site-specific DNA recombinase